MRTQPLRPAARFLLALAVVLGSLWVGGLAAREADAADQLTAVTQPGVEVAVLGDRAAALRPRVGRFDPSGRLVPVLHGMLVAALLVAAGARAGRSRPGMAQVRSLLPPTPRGARAPPFLQQA